MTKQQPINIEISVDQWVIDKHIVSISDKAKQWLKNGEITLATAIDNLDESQLTMAIEESSSDNIMIFAETVAMMALNNEIVYTESANGGEQDGINIKFIIQ